MLRIAARNGESNLRSIADSSGLVTRVRARAAPDVRGLHFCFAITLSLILA
jgi:hypothetical protein